MSDTVFHGSPVDITGPLKPLGWSRHLQSKGLYLTSSELVGVAYALQQGAIDLDDAKSFGFYNDVIDDWEEFIIVKSQNTPIGYVYEVNRPTESPVSYYDSKTESETQMPTDIAVWALAHDVPVLQKHVVDYNYMKRSQNPFNIKVQILKHKKDFKEAIQKLKQAEQEIGNSARGHPRAVENFRRILDEYTDR